MVPKKRAALPEELAVPYFPDGSAQRENLVITVIKLDKWIASVVVRGLEQTLDGLCMEPSDLRAAELNEVIAESLARHTRGIENQILRKSIEETLYCCTGTEEDWTRFQFEGRLKAFVRKNGASGFVRMFLSLHVFNVVCFHTRDSVMRDPDSLDRYSQRIVNNLKPTLHPLTRSSAEQLVADVARRLEEIL